MSVVDAQQEGEKALVDPEPPLGQSRCHRWSGLLIWVGSLAPFKGVSVEKIGAPMKLRFKSEGHLGRGSPSEGMPSSKWSRRCLRSLKPSSLS